MFLLIDFFFVLVNVFLRQTTFTNDARYGQFRTGQFAVESADFTARLYTERRVGIVSYNKTALSGMLARMRHETSYRNGLINHTVSHFQ